MHIKIRVWYGMGAHNNPNPIALFQIGFKGIDVGAGGIPHDHAGSQMNNLRAILDHFFTRVLDIATRTAITRRKAYQLDLRVPIFAESPVLVLHGPETFPAGTPAVAVADHDSNLSYWFHCTPVCLLSLPEMSVHFTLRLYGPTLLKRLRHARQKYRKRCPTARFAFYMEEAMVGRHNTFDDRQP